MESNPKPRKARILFLVLAIMVLGYALVMGAMGLVATMGIAAFLSLTLFLLSLLDEFSSIKASAGGIEAHMKKVVEEAEDTVGEIKKLSVIIAKLQLSMLIRQGRFGGYKPEEREKHQAEILSLLERMGVSKAEQDEAMEDVHLFTRFDLYRAIVAPSSKMRSDIPLSISNEWAHISQRDIHNTPKPDEIREVLQGGGILHGEIAERLEDYEFYTKHGRRRRPAPTEADHGAI